MAIGLVRKGILAALVAGGCPTVFSGEGAAADPAARDAPVLEKLAKLPSEVVRVAEEDFRAYLDARLATRIGPVFFARERMTRKNPDGSVMASQYWGRAPMQAYLYFDAYDVLGDEKYLRAALDLADFHLRIQEPQGFWHYAHVIRPDGTATRLNDREPPNCRIQDAHQTGAFGLLLYAWRVTGDSKYFDSAKRCADYLRSIQNANGSWPDYWIHGTSTEGVTGAAPGKAGALIGGSFNDGATSDTLWMMIKMYHLTKNPWYVERLPRIADWIFDTQIGQGKVRGWCQQYALDNTPLAARHFEGKVIEPRVFTRFIVPMATTFYLITGEERFMKLLAETVEWAESARTPQGYAYQYLPDGTPVFTTTGRTFRYDQPETWPNPLPKKGGHPTWSQDSIAGDAPHWIAKWKRLGLEGMRAENRGPVVLDAEDYRRAREKAADYVLSAKVRDEVLARPMSKLNPKWPPGEEGNATPCTPDFLMRLRIAQGRFTPEQLAPGGRPQAQRLHDIKAADWLAIPWRGAVTTEKQ